MAVLRAAFELDSPVQLPVLTERRGNIARFWMQTPVFWRPPHREQGHGLLTFSSSHP